MFCILQTTSVSTTVTGWQKRATQRKFGLAGNLWHKLKLQIAGKIHVTIILVEKVKISKVSGRNNVR
jgi:hypothetical protein